MRKRCLLISMMFVSALLAAAHNLEGGQQRRIPIMVSADVRPKIIADGEAVPLTITITNGMSSSIHHLTFSLEPNEWNGETYNISLVDIYRNDKAEDLYLARPEMDVPAGVSGLSNWEIKPGGQLDIRTDARKWKLRGGWLPGRYRATVRVDNLRVDEYTTLSVSSDPFEFEIK